MAEQNDPTALTDKILPIYTSVEDLFAQAQVSGVMLTIDFLDTNDRYGIRLPSLDASLGGDEDAIAEVASQLAEMIRSAVLLHAAALSAGRLPREPEAVDDQA